MMVNQQPIWDHIIQAIQSITMSQSLAIQIATASSFMDKHAAWLSTVMSSSTINMEQIKVLATVFACGMCMGMWLVAMLWIGWCCCSGFSGARLQKHNNTSDGVPATGKEMKEVELMSFTNALLEQVCVMKGMNLGSKPSKECLVKALLSCDDMASTAQLRYIKTRCKKHTVQPQASNLLSTLSAGQFIDKLKAM